MSRSPRAAGHGLRPAGAAVLLGDGLADRSELFSDHGILQPIRQLGRPVNALTDEERPATASPASRSSTRARATTGPVTAPSRPSASSTR
ncbi:DUF4132 domain-containing protein [Kitasatospora sp. NPDC101157]|uniref:DUF4132 domain-containing protein n=1 Tax=Kitasatospora sp. NPDC101157 TaxID=3364098 RepID=UPI003824A9D6